MCTDQMFTTGGKEPVLAVSLELAAAKWNVALDDSQREKAIMHTAAEPRAAGRLQAVLDPTERHKENWPLPAGRRIVHSRHRRIVRRARQNPMPAFSSSGGSRH